MTKFLSISVLLSGTLLLAGCGAVKEEQVKKPEESTESTKEMTQSEVTTPSGLKYTITQEGTGESPQKGQKVTVHYTGWILEDDGTKGVQFDSSVDRGQAFSFPIGVGRVIQGWDEGVASMKVGEKRTLVIPANLGYGSRGAGALIAPNSTLIFDVELLKIG